MTPMTDQEALAVLEVAAKRLRAPGVAGVPSGPLTAEELDQARAHIAARLGSVPAAVSDAEVEVACRFYHGERWLAMSDSMKESPRRWMRDALQAAAAHRSRG